MKAVYCNAQMIDVVGVFIADEVELRLGKLKPRLAYHSECKRLIRVLMREYLERPSRRARNFMRSGNPDLVVGGIRPCVRGGKFASPGAAHA